MNTEDVLYEYQQVLLGRSKKMHPKLFQSAPAANERTAIIILKYVVEHLLEWSPKEMYYKFNEQIADQFKLRYILSLIRIPPEVSRNDYFIYSYILYPGKVDFDREHLILVVYKRILSGTTRKYPKGFFEDEYGKFRAEVCLRYVLTQSEDVFSIADLYKRFSCQDGYSLLRQYRLTLALHYGWETPLDFLHESLLEGDKNEAWYHFYKLLPSMPDFE